MRPKTYFHRKALLKSLEELMKIAEERAYSGDPRFVLLIREIGRAFTDAWALLENDPQANFQMNVDDRREADEALRGYQ